MASNAENVSIWWRHHGAEKIGYETLSPIPGIFRPQNTFRTTYELGHHLGPFSRKKMDLFVILHIMTVRWLGQVQLLDFTLLLNLLIETSYFLREYLLKSDL